MKDYAEETKVGPTEDKMPTTIYVKHADLPGIEELALGDRVKLVVEGHIRAQRMGEDNCDGETCVDIHSMENVEPVKKENAATMHMDKLKSKIAKKDEEVDKEADVEEKEEEADEKD
jgi:hypothetical protein